MPLIGHHVNKIFTKREKRNGQNFILKVIEDHGVRKERWVKQSGRTGTKFMTENKLTRLGDIDATKIPVYTIAKSKISRDWKLISYVREDPVSISLMANAIIDKLKPGMKNIVVDTRGLDYDDDSYFRSIRVYPNMSKKLLFNKINNEQIDYDAVKGQGSDQFGVGVELDTTFFRIRFKQEVVGGNGARKDLKIINTEYFKSQSYPSSHGDCLLAILKKNKQISTIRKELELDGGVTINDIPKLEKYFGVNINILNDQVTINKKIRDKKTSNSTVVEYEYDYYYESKGHEKGELLNILLKDEHYSLIIKFKELYFDPICGDKLKVVKDKPVNMSKIAIKKSLIRQGRTIAGEEKEDEESLVSKLLFFDIETIFNPKNLNLLEPYSVAWHVSSSPKRFNENNLNKYIEETYFITGKDCIDKFVNWIENNDKGIRYILIGYNNSRFDNFMLLRSVINADIFTSMNFVQNSILPLRFSSRHRTFDLCRFVMSSLKDACKNFNIFPKKLDGFSHYEPQNAFMKNGWTTLNEWITKNNENLKKYNKLDVLSTESLFYRVRKSINELTPIDILDYTTLAQLSYDVFSKSIKKDKNLEIKAPLTHYDDKFIRSAVTGGRCQDFKKNYKNDEELYCVDVKSLYPYVMLNRYYPIGEYKPTKKYVEDCMGIYSVKITKQPTIKIIPNRNEIGDEVLDWDYDGEIIKNLTSVEIECIWRHGGELEFINDYRCDGDKKTKYVGIYWENRSCKLFEKYFTPIKNEKTKQDKLSKNNDKNYNPALRNITKLLLNSLSGKFVQRNFSDRTQMIKNPKEEKKFTKITKDQELKMIIGDYRLLSGELIEEKVYDRRKAKPSYIGVFIYAYARTYMYDVLYSNYDVLYTDTDSGILNKKDWEDFKNKKIKSVGIKNKHHHELTAGDGIPTIGNEFGQFEEEFNSKGKKCESYIIGKKIYCVEITDDKGVIQPESKYRMKGVNLKRDRFISENEVSIIQSIKNDEEQTKYVYKLKQDLDNNFDNLSELFDENGVSKQRLLSINIFRELNKGKVYFLCGQIKKVDCMSIKQAYTIKIITKDEVEEIGIDHNSVLKHKIMTKINQQFDRIENLESGKKKSN